MHQLIANALLAASIYALVGFGFALVYRSSRFFHFAHGLIFTAGPYLAFCFLTTFELPLIYSIVLALGSATLLGCVVELLVYRPLRRADGSPLILLLASLGFYI